MKRTAQEVPTENQQEVQQGEHEPGSVRYWTPGQMSVILQKPIEEVPNLPIGHTFKYQGGIMRIVNREEDGTFAILREPTISASAIAASEMSPDLPTSIGNAESFFPESVFVTPYADEPGHQIGRVLVRPKPGPLEKKIAEPGTLEGGDTKEKHDALGDELKVPHEPALLNKNIRKTGEPFNTGIVRSSVPSEEQVAAIMAADFAHYTKPMLLLAEQGHDVRTQLEVNHAEFQNSTIERFGSLYPDLVFPLLEGYSDTKSLYMKSLSNPKMIQK